MTQRLRFSRYYTDNFREDVKKSHIMAKLTVLIQPAK
jgi:hypothetical protein